MKLVLTGPQGCGKGTQAKILEEKFNLAHISSGDIFRENIKNNTPLGQTAKSYIDKGELVPDELTVEMVEKRLEEPDCQKGYILDGFPRNVNQAKKLSEYQKLDHVILIDVDEQESIRRISNRRSCPKCGKIYNILTMPPKNEGVCDIDGETLIQRDDDKSDAIKKRLELYHEQTKPILEYYKEKGKVIEIDGSLAPKQVSEEILSHL